MEERTQVTSHGGMSRLRMRESSHQKETENAACEVEYAIYVFFFLSRDADGAIVRPLPRAKRMLSEATCLPHLVQVCGGVVSSVSILASNFSFIHPPAPFPVLVKEICRLA